MKSINMIFLACIIFIFIIGSIDMMSSEERKIVVEISLPKKVRPGEKPFSIGKRLLQKLLPEIKNPRLMSLSDLSDLDIPLFLEEGNVFVLSGDFNNDGIADVAFVGKGDNIGDNSFFVIVSIKDGKIAREFFNVIDSRKIAIEQRYYKDKKAILLIFTYGSEDTAFIYWDGKQYRIAAGGN